MFHSFTHTRFYRLCFSAGTTFLYTTHGWSLVSAVAEGASGHKFPVLLQGLFKDLGLKETYLDENDSIIYNRARWVSTSSRTAEDALPKYIIP